MKPVSSSNINNTINRTNIRDAIFQAEKFCSDFETFFNSAKKFAGNLSEGFIPGIQCLKEMRVILGIIPKDQNPPRTDLESNLHQDTQKTDENIAEDKVAPTNKLRKSAAAININKSLEGAQDFAISLWTFLTNSSKFLYSLNKTIIPTLNNAMPKKSRRAKKS